MNKVCDNFTVRIRLNLIARGYHLLAQGVMIFNDAVVYDRYARGHMGVRVYAARCSVRRPPSM